MAADTEIISLADVLGLEPLHDVCRKFNIEITAYGSVVRRLYQRLRGRSEQLPDLYKLSPLLSDIDLKHTGTSEKSRSIREAILGSVQSAECFRWEIHSENDLAEFVADEVHLPILPANRLQLATLDGRGITDTWGGKRDIDLSRYRLLSNGFYERSKLRQQDRTSLLLHALMYLNVLLDSDTPINLDGQPGWRTCCNMIDGSVCLETIISLQRSAYLRARVLYRLKAMRSSAHDLYTWKEATIDSGLSELLDYLDANAVFGAVKSKMQIERPDSFPMVSSCKIGGDVYRLPHEIATWSTGVQAEVDWANVTRHSQLEGVGMAGELCLATGGRVIACSQAIPFNEGVAECSDDNEQIQSQEHLHFQLLLPDDVGEYCRKMGEESLGVLLALSLKVHPYSRSPVFSEHEIRDLPGFAARLSKHADAVSALLWQSLPSADQAKLAGASSPDWVPELAKKIALRVLNDAIGGPAIYNRERFQDIQVQPEVLHLARQAPTGTSLRQVNRRLLEDAYPLELFTNPKDLREYHSCVVPLSGCCFLAKFEAEESRVKHLLQVRLDCGGLLRVFPSLAREVMPSEMALEGYELRLFVVTGI